MSGSASWKQGRLTKESEMSKTIYNLFIKRNSSYVSTIFAFAIVGGIAFDRITDSMWTAHNKGKLWKDFKGKLADLDE